MKYELVPVRTRCPICEQQEGERLYSVSSSEAASHFISEAKNPGRYQRLKEHIERLWNCESCDIVQCCDCGFCYAWPFRSGDAIFYNLAYDFIGYPLWKWEHQETLDSIRNDVLPSHPEPLRILEIGAGDGAFVKGITPEVTSSNNIVCTEYTAFGIEHIRRLGVTCYDKDIRDLFSNGFEEPFDIVCMFQVLEHQDRLDELFETFTRICTKNAHLYISVPNQKFIEFIETNDALLDMPPNHIGRWNSTCFKAMGQRHGWYLSAHKVGTSESFISRARKFAVYLYMRQSQRHGTLASSVLRLRNNKLRVLAQAALVAS